MRLLDVFSTEELALIQEVAPEFPIDEDLSDDKLAEFEGALQDFAIKEFKNDDEISEKGWKP